MSVPVRPISLTDLRTQPVITPDRDSVTRFEPYVTLPPDVLSALADAVEAAHTLRAAQHVGRVPDPPAMLELNFDRVRQAGQTLDAALARFVFGGASGQPTTTKGGET